MCHCFQGVTLASEPYPASVPWTRDLFLSYYPLHTHPSQPSFLLPMQSDAGIYFCVNCQSIRNSFCVRNIAANFGNVAEHRGMSGWMKLFPTCQIIMDKCLYPASQDDEVRRIEWKENAESRSGPGYDPPWTAHSCLKPFWNCTIFSVFLDLHFNNTEYFEGLPYLKGVFTVLNDIEIKQATWKQKHFKT